ncbi:MAG: hypothetical protein DMENIID0002_01640 [Rickettsia endosymbiont of Sergentomyia squamirostris]|uniref:Uncharacterized protein n=1 Tax=Candidatus Tisiphia endosymbiont of Sergentomyia squamirostris TaxID=3113639 RepID=A0AAT9G6W2_9RICK
MKELQKFEWVEKLAILIKSEDQIKQQNEKYKFFYQYKFDTDKHYDAVCYHDKKLKADKKELEEKLKKEQRKSKEAKSLDALKIIEQKLEHKNKQILEIAHTVTEAKERKAEVDKTIAVLAQEYKRSANQWNTVEKAAKECQYLDPDKHKVLKIFVSLARNQEAAITGNGIVNDTILRNKIINFIRKEGNKMGGRKTKIQTTEKQLIFLT